MKPRSISVTHSSFCGVSNHFSARFLLLRSRRPFWHRSSDVWSQQKQSSALQRCSRSPSPHQIKRRLMRLSPTAANLIFGGGRGGRGFDEWKSIVGGIIKPLVSRASDLGAREATANSASTSRYITLPRIMHMLYAASERKLDRARLSLCDYSTNSSTYPRKTDRYNKRKYSLGRKECIRRTTSLYTFITNPAVVFSDMTIFNASTAANGDFSRKILLTVRLRLIGLHFTRM